jgi:hypothetical protein
MSPADLYVALWVLSQSTLSAPYGGEVCLNGGTPPLCSIQISSGSLPLFGSLYDGEYPLPLAQGFPNWFFSYQDRTTHRTAPPASCTDSSKPTLDGATPSIFTFSPEPSPAQTYRSEACDDKASSLPSPGITA